MQNPTLDRKREASVGEEVEWGASMGGLWTGKWPDRVSVFTAFSSFLLPIAHHWRSKQGRKDWRHRGDLAPAGPPSIEIQQWDYSLGCRLYC